MSKNKKIPIVNSFVVDDVFTLCKKDQKKKFGSDKKPDKDNVNNDKKMQEVEQIIVKEID